MTFSVKKASRHILIALMILSISCGSMLSTIQTARAEGIDVPTNQMFDIKSITTYLKTFTLDRIAVMIANQLLQKMTASVVNWINKGFQGSPAFLTNPEGFFLDAADQITGEFLSGSGELSRLCSPFSFDIRLNIALNQTTSYNKRYECTLSRVISNTQNSIATIGQNSGINIYGDPNGATLGNFVNGDFSQGGWNGFLAYTVEPQNNAIGAYLMAQSDLQSRTAEKKSKIDMDLNRGNGFMSWQKCTDVTDNYMAADEEGSDIGQQFGLNPSDIRDLETSGVGRTGYTNLGKATSIKKTVDPKTLQPKYEDCQTQTPGSILGGSLQRKLNVPDDKLVLVKTITDSIDAMLGALMNQMLTQGLAALSSRGSSSGGGSQSYLTQLYEESGDYNSPEARNLRDRANGTSNAIAVLATNNSTTYQQTVDLLTDSKNKYTTARTCFSAKLNTISNLSLYEKSYAESQIRAIDLIIARDLDPLISSTTLKKLAARRQAELFQDSINAVSRDGTTIPGVTANDFTVGFNKVESAVSAGTNAVQSGVDSATAVQQEYSAAQTNVENLNKNAQIFQAACSQFPLRSSGNR